MDVSEVLSEEFGEDNAEVDISEDFVSESVSIQTLKSLILR